MAGYEGGVGAQQVELGRPEDPWRKADLVAGLDKIDLLRDTLARLVCNNLRPDEVVGIGGQSVAAQADKFGLSPERLMDSQLPAAVVVRRAAAHDGVVTEVEIAALWTPSPAVAATLARQAARLRGEDSLAEASRLRIVADLARDHASSFSIHQQRAGAGGPSEPVQDKALPSVGSLATGEREVFTTIDGQSVALSVVAEGGARKVLVNIPRGVGEIAWGDVVHAVPPYGLADMAGIVSGARRQRDGNKLSQPERDVLQERIVRFRRQDLGWVAGALISAISVFEQGEVVGRDAS